jgi:hypothetical protein
MPRTATAILVIAGFLIYAPPTPAAERSHERSADQSKGEALRYWTERRMRHAETRSRTLPDVSSPQAAGVAGEPGAIAGTEPDHAQQALVRREAELDRAYPVDSTAPQNWWHGKLFGKDRTGAYDCSATAVVSRNRSVIFTAGHCVRLNGVWAKKLVFVPAYRHGERPFGSWVWDLIRIPGQWAARENDNFDYGAVAMSPQGGVRLTDAVGAAGLAWNQPRGVYFTLFGYPSNYFNGEQMTGCDSTSFLGDDSGKGPSTVGVSCDMSTGSSGGAWLVENTYLNSVMSYGLTNRPELSFGPYFTGAANKLLGKSERD